MNVEEIKNTYSMKDILVRYGLPQPNRAGFIHCPFHRGDREPSMKVYDKDFNCFGCGANGDIFTFVMKMDNLSFKEAFCILGGSYERDFSSRIKIYRAQKAREMVQKQEEKLREKKQLNNMLIGIYMNAVNREKPLSDAWCDNYNALQKQLYLQEILNDPEECNGIIKQTG